MVLIDFPIKSNDIPSLFTLDECAVFDPTTKVYEGTTKNNVYGMKSLYSYKLIQEGTQFKSPLYGQDFFDTNVRIFSTEEKLISLHPHTIFVTDSPSLEMSIEHPYFEDNKFTKTCYTIPGTVDIGKYYRFIDFAFHIKKEYNTFEIDEGDGFGRILLSVGFLFSIGSQKDNFDWNFCF